MSSNLNIFSIFNQNNLNHLPMNSKFTNLLRIVLGLGLLVMGVNKLLPVTIIPPLAYTQEAADFLEVLANTGYLLFVVGIVEIFIGILLLFRKWIPFALILLAPITVNILLFHLFMDLPGLGWAILVAAINGILLYKHWRIYRLLFR